MTYIGPCILRPPFKPGIYVNRLFFKMVSKSRYFYIGDIVKVYLMADPNLQRSENGRTLNGKATTMHKNTFNRVSTARNIWLQRKHWLPVVLVNMVGMLGAHSGMELQDLDMVSTADSAKPHC